MDVTVSFEMEGVARIQGNKRSDAFGEHTQGICRLGLKITKKMRGSSYYLCKTDLMIVGPFAKSARPPPSKKINIVKVYNFDHHHSAPPML